MMNGQPVARRFSPRRLFWLALPLLTTAAFVVVVISSLDLVGYEGQFVNLLRPASAATLVGAVQMGQTFVAPRPGLSRIDVLLYGFHRRNTQAVAFHLREAGAQHDKVTSTFNAGEVWDWRWMSFDFGPLADSEGKAYYFYLDSATSTPEDGLTIGGVEGDLYPYGTAIVNGQPVFAEAAFKTFYANVSVGDKLSALAAKITASKPSIWGDVRLYVLLGLLYLLLMVRLLWRIATLREP